MHWAFVLLVFCVVIATVVAVDYRVRANARPPAPRKQPSLSMPEIIADESGARAVPDTPALPSAGRPRVVFTTTSIPSRMDDPSSMVALVHNLFEQTVRPDAVHLNIPYHSVREKRDYEVPTEVQALVDGEYAGRLQVNRCDDYGPATKVLGCLEHETDGDTLLLPVDDDVLFPPRYYEELVAYSLRHPNTVFGYHGLVDDPRLNAPQLVTQQDGPVDVVETVCGAVYRRKMFTDEIFDVDRRCSCFLTDDIAFCAHVAAKGFGRQLLASDPDYVATRGRKGMPLKHQYDAPNALWVGNVDAAVGNNVRCYRTYRSVFEGASTDAARV
jgi:hypothetical protein